MNKKRNNSSNKLGTECQQLNNDNKKAHKRQYKSIDKPIDSQKVIEKIKVTNEPNFINSSNNNQQFVSNHLEKPQFNNFSFVDLNMDSILPPILKEIYNRFVFSGKYHEYLKNKDDYYAGIGLFGIGVEDKIYRRRKFLEESLKRGFRLRPNPKPTKLFDGTVLNRPKRSKDISAKSIITTSSKTLLLRSKSKLNLFNIGKEYFKRKPKRVIKKPSLKRRLLSSNKVKSQIIKPKVIEETDDNKEKTEEKSEKLKDEQSNSDSSSDLEAQSIALTRPKRKLKVPQLEFKYCYDSAIYNKSHKTKVNELENIAVKLEKEVATNAESEKDDKAMPTEIHSIESDSSSVVEVAPPIKHEDNNPNSASFIASDSSTDKEINLKLVTNTKNRHQWKPKPNKALDLLDKLRLGLQCTIIKTENDVIIQNLNKEDLATLQSRLHGLATFKNIEVEYDKSGQETARATIDRKLLNIPYKSNENSQHALHHHHQQQQQQSADSGKNIGLKRYFDSLKRKVGLCSINMEKFGPSERKKPVLSAKSLDLVKNDRKSHPDKSPMAVMDDQQLLKSCASNSNSTASMTSSNTSTSVISSISHASNTNYNTPISAVNWTRSKVRSAKKVRKLYTQSTNTPSILSRSQVSSSNTNTNLNSTVNMTSSHMKPFVHHHHHPTFRMTPISSTASSVSVVAASSVPPGTVAGVSLLAGLVKQGPSLAPSNSIPTIADSSSIFHHSSLAAMTFYPQLSNKPIPASGHDEFNQNSAINGKVISGQSSENQEHAPIDLSKPTKEPSKSDDKHVDNTSIPISSSSSCDQTVVSVQTSTCTTSSLPISATAVTSTALPSSSRTSTCNTTLTSTSNSHNTSNNARTSCDQVTPATAMSASQLLMMKKGSNNGSCNSNNGPNGNINSNNQFRVTDALSHHSIIQMKSNEHLANQILKPYKLLVLLPPIRRGSTAQLIPCYRSRELIHRTHRVTNNLASPPKLELDDDEDDGEFELPIKSTIAPIASATTNDGLSTTGPTTGGTTTTATTYSGSATVSSVPFNKSQDDSLIANTSQIEPIIDITASTNTISSNDAGSVSSLSSPVTNISQAKLIQSSNVSKRTIYLSPNNNKLLATPNHSATTTTTSAPSSNSSSNTASPSTNIKIRHRKWTHNFHTSSNVNFRQVLCSSAATTTTSAATSTTNSTISVPATFVTTTVPITTIRSIVSAKPNNNNATPTCFAITKNNITNNNISKLGSPIKLINTNPNLHISNIHSASRATTPAVSASGIPMKSSSCSNVVLKSLLAGGHDLNLCSSIGNSLANTNQLSSNSVCINNITNITSNISANISNSGVNKVSSWASKYLGHHSNSILHDSKIKWQVGGTIISTVSNDDEEEGEEEKRKKEKKRASHTDTNTKDKKTTNSGMKEKVEIGHGVVVNDHK